MAQETPKLLFTKEWLRFLVLETQGAASWCNRGMAWWFDQMRTYASLRPYRAMRSAHIVIGGLELVRMTPQTSVSSPTTAKAERRYTPLPVFTKDTLTVLSKVVSCHFPL